MRLYKDGSALDLVLRGFHGIALAARTAGSGAWTLSVSEDEALEYQRAHVARRLDPLRVRGAQSALEDGARGASVLTVLGLGDRYGFRARDVLRGVLPRGGASMAGRMDGGHVDAGAALQGRRSHATGLFSQGSALDLAARGFGRSGIRLCVGVDIGENGALSRGALRGIDLMKYKALHVSRRVAPRMYSFALEEFARGRWERGDLLEALGLNPHLTENGCRFEVLFGELGLRGDLARAVRARRDLAAQLPGA